MMRIEEGFKVKFFIKNKRSSSFPVGFCQFVRLGLLKPLKNQGFYIEQKLVEKNE
jgi:hypothetical protein